MRAIPTRAAAALSTLSLLALVLAAPARADESSGTWTGVLELRQNYYWETSTRVIAPEILGQLDSPDGTRIRASYLVDAITSASIAAGAQEDIRFTEVRNQGSLGVSHELDLGDVQLDLGVAGGLSHEPDYLATNVRAFGVLSFNQRASSLAVSLGYIHDDVGMVLRGGERRVDDTGRDLSDRGRQGQLEGISAGLTFNQVLTPVTTLVVGYQLLHNWGYLQNPYRRARVGDGLQSEVHPTERTRSTISGRLAHFFPETQTAVHLMYRAYLDDWEVGALTPEVRVYQMIGPSVVLRVRYRYYDQVDSFFFQDRYSGTENFFSADPKMSNFSSHLFGLQMRVGLDFFRDTPLEFLSRAWVDFSFNYWFQTSQFGDGVLAQAGIRAPF